MYSRWSNKFIANPVNLNLDNLERLKTLPWVGKILAAVIVEKKKRVTLDP